VETACRQDSRRLDGTKVSLLLVDDDAVAVDSAFDGDAEQGVVPDFAVVGAAGRAHGATAGEGENESGGGGEKSEFLHVFLLLMFVFHACLIACTRKQIMPISS